VEWSEGTGSAPRGRQVFIPTTTFALQTEHTSFQVPFCSCRNKAKEERN